MQSVQVAKNQSAPFSRPDCQNEKIKKNICTLGPMPVPLGGCEKRTPLRSFRLSANQPSTDIPNVKYLRFAFLFFSSLSAHCDKKISPLLLKFFYHTSHALFVMRKNTLKHQNKN